MQREVETVALDVLRHAEADNLLDHEEDDQAGDGIIDEDDGDPDALIEGDCQDFRVCAGD